MTIQERDPKQPKKNAVYSRKAGKKSDSKTKQKTIAKPKTTSKAAASKKAPANSEDAAVEAYLNAQPLERQGILRKVQQVIRQAAPDALEKISYGMPTFWQGKNLVHFANFKNHLGFYPTPPAIEHFAQELAGFKTSKGAVQFPYAKEIPYDLIEEITRWQVARQIKGE